MLNKNDEVNLIIDGMTAEGEGVAHLDGQAIFVRGTVVGDEIIAHIIFAKKNYAVAKLTKIITPSPDRIESDCPVSDKCGGCSYRQMSYEAELRIKQQKVEDAFKRIGHLDIEVDKIIGSKTEGYRNKAQYPVARDTRDDSLLIGFYAWNTHRIVPCRDCRLQDPVFKNIVDIVANWAERNGIYCIRHIYVRRAHFTGEIMVCLVINEDGIDKKEELINELAEKIENVKTILLNINKKDTNVILGSECKMLLGDGYINDKLLEKTFRISPLSFYQVNSEQCEVLYSKAAEFAHLTGSETLLDLYCGTGTIGLTMACKVKHLVGVEIVPEAVEDARKNAEINGIENAEFYCGDAGKITKDLSINPDVILIDPPRKGMSEELVSTVVEMKPDRVVYVSCDPATLARDCARFATLGYTVSRACPVDMFPRTAHVETVCLLIKKSLLLR